jgi:Na+-driven multidrug efflux pump
MSRYKHLWHDIIEAISGTEQDFSTGRLGRAILLLSIPMVLEMLLESVFAVVDILFVAGLGSDAVAMAVANIINMILDPIFIYGWGPIPAFGVEGAAIATTTGRSIGVLYQFYLLFSRKYRIQLSLKYFIPDLRVIRKLIALSLGGIAQNIIMTSSWIGLIRIYCFFWEQCGCRLYHSDPYTGIHPFACLGAEQCCLHIGRTEPRGW